MADAGDAAARLQRAIAEVDRSCAQDIDCALVEINTPCAPHCDVYAVARSGGLDVLNGAVRAVTESCAIDSGPEPWYTASHCSSRGFEARCREGRCERAAALCSPPCRESGDSCVGAPGIACQRCPSPDENVDGPCAVVGQRCHLGACGTTADCILDANSDAGSWLLDVGDCI